MARHPEFYTDLLRRRFTHDPPLTPDERHELHLHLMICAECNFDYAHLLFTDFAQQAEARPQHLDEQVNADVVIPYLRDLVRAQRAGRPLTGFQRMIWEFVCRDREALGCFRAIEADWLLQRVQ